MVPDDYIIVYKRSAACSNVYVETIQSYEPPGLETGRPDRPNKTSLSGRAGQVFCRAGPARRFYDFFYFLSNCIPVITDRNH